MTIVTQLKPNQVFVFGSNENGFHGAGAAGMACRGTASNTWRTDQWFLRAMKSLPGSDDRIGKWAVYGVGRGWQKGKKGMSYAVATVTRPGARRSISLREIAQQLLHLVDFAREHPEWEFLVTRIGEGYAGYTHEEMQGLWNKLGDIPSNIIML